MASGGISDPAFASAMSDLQHPHHLFQHPPPSTLPSSSHLPVSSDLDSLSVLSAGTSGAVQHPGGAGGGARDNSAAISLSHVLSGLQEEGALADVLQEQPSLAHGTVPSQNAALSGSIIFIREASLMQNNLLAIVFLYCCYCHGETAH